MPVTKHELRAPSFTIDRESARAVREFHIPSWSDVDAFITEMDGSVTIAGNIVVRTGYATFPGKPWLILENIQIEPMNDEIMNADAEVATCQAGARAVVTYATQEFDQSGNQEDDENLPQLYMTHSIKGSTQAITHSTASLAWEKDGAKAGDRALPDDALPAMPMGIVDHQITWENLPRVNWTAIGNTFNRTNDATFLTHRAETVWFQSFGASRRYGGDGTRRWNLDYSFKARIIPPVGAGANQVFPGWNHFLRPNPAAADQAWQKVLIKDPAGGAGVELLPPVDLGQLFEF